MATIYSEAVEAWYSNNNQQSNASWALHSSFELTASHVRPGRIQFASLSGGKPITNLDIKFQKINTGGGGVFKLYSTDNVNLLPSQLASMTYLGESPVYGSGSGWKTLTLTSSIYNVLAQYTGTWYLIMTCAVYTQFDADTSTARFRFEGAYLDGVFKLHNGTSFVNGVPYVYNGTAWVPGIPYVYDGTQWKPGIN